MKSTLFSGRLTATAHSGRSYPSNTCQVILIQGKAAVQPQNISPKAKACIQQTIQLGDMPKKFAATHLTPLEIPNNTRQQRIMMVQLGQQGGLTENNLRQVVQAIASSSSHTSAKHIALSATALVAPPLLSKSTQCDESALVSLLIREIALQQYKHDSKTAKTILIETRIPATVFSRLKQRALALAGCMQWAINTANLPSNICTPAYLAKETTAIAKQLPRVAVKHLTKKELAKNNMGGILSVAKGSAQEPLLIQATYTPKKAKQKKPVVLVGKGVTFDSGGISLKPAKQMDEMKFDMCGATTALATFFALAKTEYSAPVVALVPVVENMPSSTAVKPGDVITMHAGKTVEVLNTDAEGRLILADALSFAIKHNPACIIDIATLTGACIVALGRDLTALVSNSQALSDKLIVAGNTTFDSAWQLPLYHPYTESMDSNFADLANIGTGGEAGTIMGALFLNEFVKSSIPWAHLDIAGVAWKTGKAKSATGRPIPLLFECLHSYFASR